MSDAAVTVVVPTKDRRDLLAVTVRSILTQVDADVRVIVVDDGSTDGSAAWAATMGDRVAVVTHDAPRGAAASRNDGLARVTTAWVAFCDDDDVWAPTKVRAQLAAIETTPGAVWSCTGAVCVDSAFRVVNDQRLERGGDVRARLLISNDIPGGGSSVLVRTDVVRGLGGFAEDLPSSEDWDLWIRLAATGPLAVVDEPLVGYRVWSGGKSRHVDRMEAAFDAIERRHRELAASLGVVADRRAHQRFLAKQALAAGDRSGAAKRFLRAGRPGRAAAAVVAPRVLDRIGSSRMHAAVDADWRAAAERWLAPLRAEAVADAS